MNAFEMLWKALEEMGEFTFIRYARVPREKSGAARETFFFPHSHFDGVGSYAMLLDTYEGGYVSEARQTRSARVPPFYRRIGMLIRDLRGSHHDVVPWKRFDRTRLGGPPTCNAYLVLDEEESARIYAPGDDANPNSRLLWALDRAIAGDVIEGSVPRHLWMMPVNMRDVVKITTPYASYAAQIPIEISPGGKPSDIRTSIRHALATGMHWGAWDSANLFGHFGMESVRKFVRKYYSRPGHAWVGVFSNLGEWKSRKAPASDWVGFPPVTLANPISGSSAYWGGRVVLCLQVHRALSEDPADAERWVRMWRENVLSVAPATKLALSSVDREADAASRA